MTAFLEPFRDYGEWVAAGLGLVTVLLVIRRSIWNYPFALAMVALYFFEFLDEKLYSDALLQIFFFAINLFGWWAWSRARQVDDGVEVGEMQASDRVRWAVATAALTLLLGWAMARFTDAAAPYVDAAVAGLSVAAQWLQSLRRIESWLFWIAADLVAIPLYTWKGMLPTAVLYGIFLVMAVGGFLSWRKSASTMVVPA